MLRLPWVRSGALTAQGGTPAKGRTGGENLSTSAQTGHVLSLFKPCPVGGLPVTPPGRRQ
ncbi:hypothetical protein GCM10010214_28260 [Streptomyces abikoensis]|nr:hypothetical protein GCM10010214_28260 [Streptomyces abikoensis]